MNASEARQNADMYAEASLQEIFYKIKKASQKGEYNISPAELTDGQVTYLERKHYSIECIRYGVYTISWR